MHFAKLHSRHAFMPSTSSIRTYLNSLTKVLVAEDYQWIFEMLVRYKLIEIYLNLPNQDFLRGFVKLESMLVHHEGRSEGSIVSQDKIVPHILKFGIQI